MITEIEIKNFKSIKSRKFQMKNLNILLGLNGQGKSSFIQSLLLLRQSNTDSSWVKGRLYLNGKYVEIGNSKDAFYQYARKEDLIFNLSFDNGITIPFHYAYEMERDVLAPTQNMSDEARIHFESLIQATENYTGLFSEQFAYLSAYRIKPQSIYPKSNYDVVHNRNLGINGQFTVHFIETYHDEEIAFENLIHPKSYKTDPTFQKEIVDKTLINQINLWLGEISPGILVKTTSISQRDVLLEYVYEQPNYGTTNKFKPLNVGFGITYVLPVVTALLSAKPGSLLIIENPESHIHPRGQAELGKLIALVAQNNVQIIIETHSDHLLNGIRVAVKENLLPPKNVILFYFQKTVKESEQYSEITDIRLDNNGTLSEYPENLLDEWSNQLAKLL